MTRSRNARTLSVVFAFVLATGLTACSDTPTGLDATDGPGFEFGSVGGTGCAQGSAWEINGDHYGVNPPTTLLDPDTSCGDLEAPFSVDITMIWKTKVLHGPWWYVWMKKRRADGGAPMLTTVYKESLDVGVTDTLDFTAQLDTGYDAIGIIHAFSDSGNWTVADSFFTDTAPELHLTAIDLNWWVQVWATMEAPVLDSAVLTGPQSVRVYWQNNYPSGSHYMTRVIRSPGMQVTVGHDVADYEFTDLAAGTSYTFKVRHVTSPIIATASTDIDTPASGYSDSEYVTTPTPLSVSIDPGPSLVLPDTYCGWYADWSGGTPPWSWVWKRGRSVVSTDDFYIGYTGEEEGQFTLTLIMSSSGFGGSDTTSITVTVDDEAPWCFEK